MRVLEAKATEIIQFKFGGIIFVEIIGKKPYPHPISNKLLTGSFVRLVVLGAAFALFVKNLTGNEISDLRHFCTNFFQVFQLKLYMWVVR